MSRTHGNDVTIALGGNAIVRPGTKGTPEEQFDRVRRTARSLAGLVKEGDRMIVTHGNGPQVGDILIQNEAAKRVVPQMPLDVLGAESQGMIGYMLQQALDESLRVQGLKTPVVTVLTQVRVDPSDPAFERPTKPIGPFYGPREAASLRSRSGWVMARAGRRGYRRVVPSPEPKEILEKEIIRMLYESGALVIAAGGGGIPVVRTKSGGLRGVEAVLDKDRTAALLATSLGTKVLLILTDVDGVYLDFEGPNRRLVPRLDLESAERLLAEGQFPQGSMGPKIESSLKFLRSGGERVVITSLESAEDAMVGKVGTTISAKG